MFRIMGRKAGRQIQRARPLCLRVERRPAIRGTADEHGWRFLTHLRKNLRYSICDHDGVEPCSRSRSSIRADERVDLAVNIPRDAIHRGHHFVAAGRRPTRIAMRITNKPRAAKNGAKSAYIPWPIAAPSTKSHNSIGFQTGTTMTDAPFTAG